MSLISNIVWSIIYGSLAYLFITFLVVTDLIPGGGGILLTDFGLMFLIGLAFIELTLLKYQSKPVKEKSHKAADHGHDSHAGHDAGHDDHADHGSHDDHGGHDDHGHDEEHAEEHGGHEESHDSHGGHDDHGKGHGDSHDKGHH